ncbi:MAG: ATP-binding protein [Solirubrobacterales bacterium]|nr:ATP-binding protein [Solirubrobacterales bacterium]
MTPTPAFALSLPARAASVTVVRHVLGGVLGVWPVSQELLDDVQIAVTEACANVVTHAYLDLPPGTVDVTGDVVDERVVIAVRDHGRGIVPRTDSPGLGMGLPLIAALTEHLWTGLLDDGVHEVRMTFPKDPA